LFNHCPIHIHAETSHEHFGPLSVLDDFVSIIAIDPGPGNVFMSGSSLNGQPQYTPVDAYVAGKVTVGLSLQWPGVTDFIHLLAQCLTKPLGMQASTFGACPKPG